MKTGDVRPKNVAPPLCALANKFTSPSSSFQDGQKGVASHMFVILMHGIVPYVPKASSLQGRESTVISAAHDCFRQCAGHSSHGDLCLPYPLPLTLSSGLGKSGPHRVAAVCLSRESEERDLRIAKGGTRNHGCSVLCHGIQGVDVPSATADSLG